jgi:hypothetical protein
LRQFCKKSFLTIRVKKKMHVSEGEGDGGLSHFECVVVESCGIPRSASTAFRGSTQLAVKCHQHNNTMALTSDKVSVEDPSNVPRKVRCRDAHKHNAIGISAHVVFVDSNANDLCSEAQLNCDYMHFEGNKHSFYRSRRKLLESHKKKLKIERRKD